MHARSSLYLIAMGSKVTQAIIFLLQIFGFCFDNFCYDLTAISQRKEANVSLNFLFVKRKGNYIVVSKELNNNEKKSEREKYKHSTIHRHRLTIYVSTV